MTDVLDAGATPTTERDDAAEQLAPGSVVVVRDEEWFVRATEDTADGLLARAGARRGLTEPNQLRDLSEACRLIGVTEHLGVRVVRA